MIASKDTVFSTPLKQIGGFEFNARVADVFENMIQRSVPGYALLLEMIGILAGRYAQAGTNCYDLGCSLGASTLSIRQNLPGDCVVIGIDNSAAMVEKCRSNMQRDHSQASVEIRQEDIRDSEIKNASLVAMNFTLQFVADKDRPDILKRIAYGINTGGVLILSEKIKSENSDRQELMTGLHHEFKKHHGYSDLEIAQKRASLENVLVPNTLSEHIDRLHTAGFSTVETYMRCLNFTSILAIK
jgi:tRNA (cmo5U34)-methyltransferase